MFTQGDAYEAYMGRWSRCLAPGFVDFVGVRDGERCLDVGTGTGALARAVEAKLGSGAVVGVDPSEAFVEYARRNARSARARFEVGKAEALPFDDRAFDRAMSLLVMNFIPEHEKALGEMRRVTRPGGSLGACVWDYGAGMQSLRVFWDEVVALDPAAAPKHERNMKLCREGELAELWRKGGLTDVQEESLEIDQAFASFADYWGPFLRGTGPGGAYVASLAPDRRAVLEARLRDRLLGAPTDEAFTLKARAWCVRGTVPGA